MAPPRGPDVAVTSFPCRRRAAQGVWAAVVARLPPGFVLPPRRNATLWAPRPLSEGTPAVTASPAAPGPVYLRPAAARSGLRRIDPGEAAGAWCTSDPGTWGNPLGVPGVPNGQVPTALAAARLVATGASVWTQVPARVKLAHPGDRAGAEEAYAAFERLMEVTGHHVHGVDNFAGFLGE